MFAGMVFTVMFALTASAAFAMVVPATVFALAMAFAMVVSFAAVYAVMMFAVTAPVPVMVSATVLFG